MHKLPKDRTSKKECSKGNYILYHRYGCITDMVVLENINDILLLMHDI